MTAVKHEWRKHEKELYCPKQQAVQVTVPSMKFLVLDGVGNPNHVPLPMISRRYIPCPTG